MQAVKVGSEGERRWWGGRTMCTISCSNRGFQVFFILYFIFVKCRLTGRCNQHQKQKFECHLDTPIRYQTAHPEGGFYLKQPILYYSPIYIPIVTQERKKEKKKRNPGFPYLHINNFSRFSRHRSGVWTPPAVGIFSWHYQLSFNVWSGRLGVR
ncbi:hypothetical protein P167DRAFT_159385 [Morchella conica CCBAS932]|uniref:Uncharacterized protein n=1 Tax=Morchella conica CCBAS932 TaxID=1392247 RepID=A0A3N4KVY5_9PEZI|nr:hypothetical protein P167DRAFT_159385 [Morchella conica CCBAS932]